MTDGGHLDPAGPQQTPLQAPEPRRGLPLGAILGIVGGGLVLLVVVVVVVAVAIVGSVSKGAATAAGASKATAQGTVKAYLTAIAAGDATKAKRLLLPSASGASQDLLTADVLAQSNRLGPITAIKVGAVGGSSSYYPDVAATYVVGTTPVSTSFHLNKNDDGTFSVVGGLARFDAGYLKGLDVTIDGAKTTVPDDGFQVFPGTYQVAIATPSLTVDGTGQVVLGSPDAYISAASLKPKLSDAGLAQFRKLVTASVTACLKQTTLKAGCGLTVPKTLTDGIKVGENSLRRSSTPQLKAKLQHLTPTPDLDTPTLMTASVGESPDVHATGTKNGEHGSFSLLFGPSFGSASIDVSQSTPTVEWG